MFLSRLILNTHSRQVQSDLRNPYDLHRTLTFAWAGEGEPLPEGVRLLWRLDGEQSPTLLVQSQTVPNWEGLSRRHPAYLNASQVSVLDETKLNALSRPEGLYHFRLRANPTVTKRAEREGSARDQKPKRFGLYSADAQAQWLAAQGERSGFWPKRFEITHSERLRARKGGSSVTLSVATFEGVLRVTGPDRFRAVLTDGLGHGKAFGLGLLSLAPLG